jgi:hypothetical protein
VNGSEKSAASAADSVQVFMMNNGSDAVSMVVFWVIVFCCR